MSASVCRFTSATGISTSISRLVELSLPALFWVGLSSVGLSLTEPSLAASSFISVGLTVAFPKRPVAAVSEGCCSARTHGAAALSVKTLEEQRQTAEGALLPTKVTSIALCGVETPVRSGWGCGSCCCLGVAAAAPLAFPRRSPQSSSGEECALDTGKGFTRANTIRANASAQLAQGFECRDRRLHALPAAGRLSRAHCSREAPRLPRP